MKLGWSKNDEPGHSRSRDIPRNCGQLLGNLDDLLPCLYIANYGASARELRERETDHAPGLFAVGESTGGDHPGVAPRVGLILPLRLCSDDKARVVLEEIPALIGNRLTTMSDRRNSAQAKLNEAFGGDLTIADKECLDGFFALVPVPVFSSGFVSRSTTSPPFLTIRQGAYISRARRASPGVHMGS